MGFSSSEDFLNGINLDSINEYNDYVRQLQPILLKEAGYETVTSTSNPFTDIDSAYRTLVQEGTQRGLSVTEIGKKLGLNASQTREAINLVTDLNKKLSDSETWMKDGRSSEESYRNAAKELQDKLKEFSVTKTSLQKTAERQALEDQYKQVQQQQLELTKAQAERQKKALAGEIPTSPVLASQIQKEFEAFKEAQARAGNVILGDDPFTAVGKGSAAIESLRGFQDNATAAKQREIQSIVQGETPLFYQGLGLAGGYGGVSLPSAPDYSGAAGLSLAGHQPFQFNRQMQFNMDALKASSKSKGNKSGLIGSLGGAGLGVGLAALAPGTLGLSSALMAGAMGSNWGGGIGTLVGGQ